MIFTTSPDALYDSFGVESMAYKDAKLAIAFETQEMMEETLILLRFNCPDSACDYLGNGWGDLKLHVRATHGKLLWYAGVFQKCKLYSYLSAICAFGSRRYLPMNMRYTLPAFCLCICHRCINDQQGISPLIKWRVVFILCANSAGNASLAAMNYILTCGSDMKSASYVNEMTSGINSAYIRMLL